MRVAPASGRGGFVTFPDFAAQSRQNEMIPRFIIGAVIGGALGFAFYKFVGCSTGACPLTSNPVISTVYGSVLGALLASSFH
jgi:hypothetical protein